jgi:hypothetical protein
METYKTLCFSTSSKATKNQKEINEYFENRLVYSEIKKGIDERGKRGFYVNYSIKN